MTTTSFLIYGAGGFARELAWLIDSCSSQWAKYEVLSFIDDDPSKYEQKLNGISVVGLETAHNQFPEALVVGGIGAPSIRQKVIEKAESKGFSLGTVIHPRVEMSHWVEIGEGSVICAGNILTTNITLGRHVQINLDCTIGHDVVMDDYATLAPGVHISGRVHIGKRVYIGTGAVIINGTDEHPLIIEDDAVVGAGACVTKSVATGLTVVGVPAKPLPRP